MEEAPLLTISLFFASDFDFEGQKCFHREGADLLRVKTEVAMVNLT